MTNNDFIKAFVADKTFNGKTNALTAKDGKLFSYNTCIAQHTNDGFLLVSNTDYSVTTTKHQNRVRLEAASKKSVYGIIIRFNVPLNAQKLG